jgi:prevent-host-death family protein
MIKTLRETKAHLSELVALAETGEDTIITVRGRPRARLTAAGRQPQSRSRRTWSAELIALHRSCGTNARPPGSSAILDALREDRA